ncbi:hypothetical protein [uncultured Aquimarina sp.]|uniref:hypothetical protein n=1 Tax=uncultured Aquimarina sp. TaxID=575652 RepID=UPI0026164AAA|nr:hypothetical protein [uncultured Aquimarina sp.]
MRAAPACLMLITFLSCNLLFCQKNVSIDKTSITKSTIQESITHSPKILEKDKIDHLNIVKSSTNKAKTAEARSKVTLEISETVTTSVPRTTLDFF